MKKPALVPDWKKSPKWFSIHIQAITAGIATVQAAFSTYAQPLMSPAAFAVTMIAFAIVGVAARLIDQPNA